MWLFQVFEKRYQAKDFSGSVLAEASAIKSSRPAFTPIFHNHYPNQSWSNKAILKDEVSILLKYQFLPIGIR